MEHILLLSFILSSVININLASTINQVGTDKKNRFRGKNWTEELRLSWSQPVIPLQLGSICLITSRLPLSVYILCPLSSVLVCYQDKFVVLTHKLLDSSYNGAVWAVSSEHDSYPGPGGDTDCHRETNQNN